jgi:hypothetical protein
MRTFFPVVCAVSGMTYKTGHVIPLIINIYPVYFWMTPVTPIDG